MLADYLMQGMGLFPEEVIAPFVKAANHARRSLRFEAWDRASMQRRWGGRVSLDQIEEEGTSNHLYNCTDSVPLAVKNLTEAGIDARLVFVTARGNVTETRKGEAPHHHIDVYAEVLHEGTTYGLNMGCGDFTFLRELEPQFANPFLNGHLHPEEIGLWTTRPERNERVWPRVPVFSISGKNLLDNSDVPFAELFGTEHDLVREKPYSLTLVELQRVQQMDGQPHLFDSNTVNYKAAAVNRWNQRWYEANRIQLPDLEAPSICI